SATCGNAAWRPGRCNPNRCRRAAKHVPHAGAAAQHGVAARPRPDPALTPGRRSLPWPPLHARAPFADALLDRHARFALPTPAPAPVPLVVAGVADDHHTALLVGQ